jgi:type IV pilus assembly protein PilA
MLHELRARISRRRKDEEGFTLIELMVVILIIAILIAIAIPTFLGARSTAQDRAAQSDLRNGLTAVKTAYVDSQNYASDQASGAWNSVEPSLTFLSSGNSTAPNQIASTTTGTDTVVLANYSKSGKCWLIEDVTGADGNDTAGTFYATQSASGGACAATTTPTGGWKASW